MRRKKRALVINDSYRIGIGVIRSLGKAGVEVTEVNAVDLSERVYKMVKSKYVSRSIVLGEFSEEKLAECLRTELKLRRYDVLIPVGYQASNLASKFKPELENYTEVPIADYDIFKRVSRKPELIDYASKIGIPTPKTVTINEINEMKRLENFLEFPVVVKPYREKTAFKVKYFDKFEKLHDFCSDFYKEKKIPLVVQEFIDGIGYGFFSLYNHGKMITCFQHERIQEYPYSGGSSSVAMSYYDKKMEFLSRKLLDSLNWHGISMVEFKKDKKDGVYYLMEVNAKFWGSLELALTCGVDFPLLLFKLGTGEIDSPILKPYKLNRKYQWIFPEDLGNVFTSPHKFSSVVRFLRDSIDMDIGINLRLSDLKPNVYLISSALFNVVLNVKKR
jgi:predicted ATP-grasp superfamily ATP-dependent carboligase